jgi:uncharacterized protein with HEPN domain
MQSKKSTSGTFGPVLQTVKPDPQSIGDQKTIYAVVRALEIIGEAVRKIPGSVRNRYPEIPWKNMAGMRDKLIHEYFGVNLRIVWDAVQKDIPPLKPLFEKILKESPAK